MKNIWLEKSKNSNLNYLYANKLAENDKPFSWKKLAHELGFHAQLNFFNIVPESIYGKSNEDEFRDDGECNLLKNNILYGYVDYELGSIVVPNQDENITLSYEYKD